MLCRSFLRGDRLRCCCTGTFAPRSTRRMSSRHTRRWTGCALQSVARGIASRVEWSSSKRHCCGLSTSIFTFVGRCLSFCRPYRSPWNSDSIRRLSLGSYGMSCLCYTRATPQVIHSVFSMCDEPTCGISMSQTLDDALRAHRFSLFRQQGATDRVRCIHNPVFYIADSPTLGWEPPPRTWLGSRQAERDIALFFDGEEWL